MSTVEVVFALHVVPGSSSLHRVLALLHRKRVEIDYLRYESGVRADAVEVRGRLTEGRIEHLLAKLGHEVVVIDVRQELEIHACEQSSGREA